MNAMPTPMDISLRRVLSMTMSLRYVVGEDKSSEVTSRIIAVIASQSPMSDVDSGKFIFRLLGFEAKLEWFGCRVILRLSRL